MSDPNAGHTSRRFCFARGVDAGEPDDALLSRFAEQGDESAFELLVWRHAAFVCRICESVLRDPHAAEDACQATFLVLARKAGKLSGGSVAGWLHTVARRIAVRQLTRRRRTHALPEDVPAVARPESTDADVVRAVQEEVARLPERYRGAVVTCLLEGLTYAEAAARLGWPLGTVAGRLSRAKEILERRLKARRIGAAAALAAVGISADAGASPRVVAAILTAVATLASDRIADVSPAIRSMYQGELNAMFVTRMSKVAVATVLIGLAAVVTVAQLPAADPPKPASVDKSPAKPAELIVGRWIRTDTIKTYGNDKSKGPTKEYLERETVEFGKDGTFQMVNEGIPELKREERKLSGTYTVVSDSEIEIEMKLDKPNKEHARPVEVEKMKSKFVVTKDELTLTEAVEDHPRTSTFKRAK